MNKTDFLPWRGSVTFNKPFCCLQRALSSSLLIQEKQNPDCPELPFLSQFGKYPKIWGKVGCSYTEGESVRMTQPHARQFGNTWQNFQCTHSLTQQFCLRESTLQKKPHTQNGMFTKLVVAAVFAVIQRHWKHPQCSSA